MITIRAVNFGVDGTLVDALDLQAEAWRQAFAFGHRIAVKGIRGRIGKGGDQAMPVLLSEAERMAQGHDIDAHRSALLERQYMPQIRAFPQVRTLFGRLRQDAVRRVIPET